MNRERIYLDHAAGSSLGLRVRAEMDRVLGWSGAAPSGGHREGREAREELTKARGRVADFLGAKDAEGVIFTSGGTDGETYKITVALTTTGGRVKQAEIKIKVKEY